MITTEIAALPRQTGIWPTMAALVLLATAPVFASTSAAVDPHTVPSVNGGIGPCSVQFTVSSGNNVPVYDAKVKVHIAYGFLNTHKMDLEVGTNVDGKARFDGLPSHVKQPLHFEASSGSLEGSAVYDPEDSCKAQHEIVLEKPENTPGAAQ